MLLKFQGFKGISPRTAKNLLEMTESQTSQNIKLYSGEMRQWDGPSGVAPQPIFEFEPETVYRAYGTSVGYVWMAWDSDVDVVEGPVNDIEHFRIYYTGDGIPKKSNASMAKTGYRNIIGPKHWMPMGFPNPTTAPAVDYRSADSAPGDSDIIETWVYCYTYVNTFGEIEEESGPSPASGSIDVAPGLNPVVWIGYFATPPVSPDPDNPYNFTKIRVYRSVKGTTETVWLFNGEFAITNRLDGTSGHLEDTTDGNNAYLFREGGKKAADLGEPLSTLIYDPPPNDLKGLVGLPNGILCGFVGNTLYFTPPYQPHAWPSAYTLTVDAKIVGLEIFGQSVVVGTESHPYIATGTDPEQITLEKLPLDAPCVSKRSLVSDQNGVMYASTEGIVGVGPSGVDIITRNVMTQYEWQTYSPSTTMGALVNGRYFLFFQRTVAPFDRGAVVLDRYIQPAPMTTLNVWASAAFVEQRIPAMFLFADGSLSQWDANPGRPLEYTWRSKYFIFQSPTNFGAFTVDADFGEIIAQQERQAQYDADLAANLLLMQDNVRGAMNAMFINGLEINGSLIKKIGEELPRFMHLRFYANGVLKYETDVADRKLKRLPSGFADDIWEIEATGNVPIRMIKVGEVMNDLRAG